MIIVLWYDNIDWGIYYLSITLFKAISQGCLSCQIYKWIMKFSEAHITGGELKSAGEKKKWDPNKDWGFLGQNKTYDKHLDSIKRVNKQSLCLRQVAKVACPVKYKNG